MNSEELITKIHYHSDFDMVVVLTDSGGNEIGFPSWDFTLTFRTALRRKVFVAGQREGKLTNCANDNGRIHVYADNHMLTPGQLYVELVCEIPDVRYPDGMHRVAIPARLDVELVRGAGSVPKGLSTAVRVPGFKVYPEEWMEQVKDTAELAAGRQVEFGSIVSDSFPPLGGRDTDSADSDMVLQPSDQGTIMQRSQQAAASTADGARMTESIVGGTGTEIIGGTGMQLPGAIAPDPDSYLGAVHYHTGLRRFVELEKTVTPAPLDADDDTAASPEACRLVAGDLTEVMPEGWTYYESNILDPVPVIFPGVGLDLEPPSRMWSRGLEIPFTNNASRAFTLRLSATSLPNIVRLMDPVTYAILADGEAVESQDAGDTLAIEGMELTMRHRYYRFNVDWDAYVAEGNAMPETLLLLVGKSARNFVVNTEPLVLASVELYRGWIFTALGGRRPDEVEYTWRDAPMPYNETPADTALPQPRTSVMYVAACGDRYVAVADSDTPDGYSTPDSTGGTAPRTALRMLATIAPDPQPADLDAQLRTATAAASALQALYAYSVVDGMIAPYEFVTVTDEDGYETVDYEATMELVIGLLDRDFPDAADGEMVYDPFVQTMWVRYASAPGGWEQYGLPEGYYLDMQEVLCMRLGFADAPQPCIVRYAWNGSRDVFTRVSAPEPMTADSDTDYTNMVNTLLTNYKIS